MHHTPGEPPENINVISVHCFFIAVLIKTVLFQRHFLQGEIVSNFESVITIFKFRVKKNFTNIFPRSFSSPFYGWRNVQIFAKWPTMVNEWNGLAGIAGVYMQLSRDQWIYTLYCTHIVTAHNSIASKSFQNKRYSDRLFGFSHFCVERVKNLGSCVVVLKCFLYTRKCKNYNSGLKEISKMNLFELDNVKHLRTFFFWSSSMDFTDCSYFRATSMKMRFMLWTQFFTARAPLFFSSASGS